MTPRQKVIDRKAQSGLVWDEEAGAWVPKTEATENTAPEQATGEDQSPPEGQATQPAKKAKKTRKKAKNGTQQTDNPKTGEQGGGEADGRGADGDGPGRE